MDDPKLFQHLTDLYNYLVDESYVDDATGADRTYSGSQRRTFDRLGLSHAYNPILYRALREMGCIEVVQRGHGRKPTILKLLRNPQITEFDEWKQTEKVERPLTSRTSVSTIEQRLNLLEKRLPNIDLASWVIGVEGRLARLEGESGKTTKRKRNSNTVD